MLHKCKNNIHLIHPMWSYKKNMKSTEIDIFSLLCQKISLKKLCPQRLVFYIINKSQHLDVDFCFNSQVEY